MVDETYSDCDVVENTWFHKVHAWKTVPKVEPTPRPEIVFSEDENGNVFGRYR